METIRVSQPSRLRTLDGWYRTEKPIVFPTFDFPSLDKLLGGGFSTGVYVLTAPPGMGKTALAKQIQDSWSRHGLWSVYASWELDAMELQARSIARISGYSFRDLYHRRVGMAEWKRALETYEEEARYTELLTPDDVDSKSGFTSAIDDSYNRRRSSCPCCRESFGRVNCRLPSSDSQSSRNRRAASQNGN